MQADALEELGGVGLGEVALGVSLHVHDAQLHVGLWEDFNAGGSQ
jgi:hypothetical protein